jgi:hypothetical protein
MDRVDIKAKVLQSSPDDLRRFLRGLFEFGRDTYSTSLTGIGELQYNNARYRGDYRNCSSNLRRLHRKVEEYIDLVEAHPLCSEESKKEIFAEIHDGSGYKRLDIEKEDRFPRTIHFLKEFMKWLANVLDKFEEVRAFNDKFDAEMKEVWDRAKDAESHAHKRRNISATAGRSSGIAATVVTAMLVWPLLLLLFVPAAAVALWGVLARDSYQEETSSHELKEKVQELRKRGQVLDEVRYKGKGEIEEVSHSSSSNQHPLLCDVKESLDIIFETFAQCSDFQKERERVKRGHGAFSMAV